GEDDTDISDIITPSNRIQRHESGILDISPKVMTIAPFKSAVLQCNFRNCALGTYDALVVADVAYLNASKDQVKYGPRRIQKSGQMPQESPVVTADMTTIAVKDLDVIAKLRIKAKCIEPRLSLDIGSTIRIKKLLRQTVKTAEYPSLNSVVFLVNESDAVCSFTLSSEPPHLFSLQPSRMYLVDEAGTQFELKQKQQMMLTINYLGTADLLSTAKKRKVSFTAQDQRLVLPGSSERKSNCIPPTALPKSPEEALMYRSGSCSLTPQSSLGSTFSRRPSCALPRRASLLPKSSHTPNSLSLAHQLPDHYEEETVSISPIMLESGSLIVSYSNGMRQEIPIVLEGMSFSPKDMTLAQRVTKAFEGFAPLSLAAKWDNVGLLVEAPFPSPRRKILLTIDLTSRVLDEAIAGEVGMIVSYHPPLFSASKRLLLSNEKQKIAMICVAKGISVYSPHTSLDVCSNGINDWLASGLGKGSLAPIVPFQTPPPGQDESVCGEGRILTLDEPVSWDVLSQSIVLTEHSNSERGYLRQVLQPKLSEALGDVQLISLQSLLFDPVPDDPQDAQVAGHYLRDRQGFEDTAREWTVKYATGIADPEAGLDKAAIGRLVEMGFERVTVVKALRETSGNEQGAIEKLLG
ncbi:NGG1 interacting factor, partial [Kappamyces sp. JEL0680]